MFLDKDKLIAAMRGNGALAWGDHHSCMFAGTERFFRPGYRTHLVSEWLPALDGVIAKVEAGATVADMGAGTAPPTDFAVRLHGPSIATATKRAAEGGVAERVKFAQPTAKNYPG